jgi:hypothetical protein
VYSPANGRTKAQAAGSPDVLLSSTSAAFLAMLHQHRQALTPSLYGLAAQTALRSLVPMLRSIVAQG